MFKTDRNTEIETMRAIITAAFLAAATVSAHAAGTCKTSQLAGGIWTMGAGSALCTFSMDNRGRVTYGACKVFEFPATKDFYTATLKFKAHLAEDCYLTIRDEDNTVIGWGRAFDPDGRMHILGVMETYGSIHIFR